MKLQLHHSGLETHLYTQSGKGKFENKERKRLEKTGKINEVENKRRKKKKKKKEMKNKCKIKK